jgi:hypothetical protein
MARDRAAARDSAGVTINGQARNTDMAKEWVVSLGAPDV